MDTEIGGRRHRLPRARHQRTTTRRLRRNQRPARIDRGVWATTPDGLQHSTDDAQTFTTVPDAPALALLAAAPDGTLWGIDTADTVWRSPDGTHWEQRSTINSVNALVARNAENAYAANEQLLYTLS